MHIMHINLHIAGIFLYILFSISFPVHILHIVLIYLHIILHIHLHIIHTACGTSCAYLTHLFAYCLHIVLRVVRDHDAHFAYYLQFYI